MGSKGNNLILPSPAINLEANKEYYYCTCGKSEDGIFCNGSHKGTEFTPKVFTVQKKSKIKSMMLKKWKTNRLKNL